MAVRTLYVSGLVDLGGDQAQHILRYDADTGEYLDTLYSTAGGVAGHRTGVILEAPGGDIYFIAGVLAADARVYRYTAAGVPVSDFELTGMITPYASFGLSVDAAENVYVVFPGDNVVDPYTVKQFDSAGALQATFTPDADPDHNIQSIHVSLDGSTLYYVLNEDNFGAGSNRIRRWDLGTDSALADFISTIQWLGTDIGLLHLSRNASNNGFSCSSYNLSGGTQSPPQWINISDAAVVTFAVDIWGFGVPWSGFTLNRGCPLYLNPIGGGSSNVVQWAPLSNPGLIQDFPTPIDTANEGMTQASWGAMLVTGPSTQTGCSLAVPVAPPLAAQQPCAPQALVGNGGKGAAGCNVGGIGGGQEYSGALGDVPQHADPPPGELLTGKEGQGIEAWIELVHTDYPSGVKTTYRRALEELADDPAYEGGRKPAGVLAIGDVENALGHEQGGFEAATADIALSDIRDRLIRELAEDQELEGDEVYVKLASDPGRAAAVAPRVLFRGIVQKPELASGLHARLTVVDALFSDFGPFGPDRKDPNWTFGDLGSSAPQMTSDTKAQVIPRLYGEKSDEGAVDPITGDPAAKGLMPGFYLGRFDLTGLVAQAPPSSGQSLAAVVAQLQASHTGGTLVADFGAIIGAGDAAVLQAMGSVPTSYTSLAQVIGYGDLDVLLSMGTTTAPPPSDWGFIATGLGPWFLYTGVYGSDLGGGNATMQHDRVQLDAANRADLLVPGVNWPFADPYFEFINDDGRVFWITGVFVMGPVLQDHLDGVVTMAFNAIGTEDVGDGTGLPLMRAEDCKQHWLENHCFDQWTSGPYTTTGTFPQWEDGTPKVNTSSFLARQNFFKSQIGGEGLLFSWYTDTQQPTLETVRQLNASSECRMGVNKDGQIRDWGLDETIDYTLWPRVNHVTDVFDQVTRTSGEERQNVVSGSGDWDADFEKFRFGPLSVSSAMGLAKYKGRRKAGDPVDSMMLDREAQLLWVLERRLARLQIGTTLIQASGSIGWLDRDVGDGILFTSEDGPGPNGYVDHPFVIVRRKTRLTTMLVQYTLWDVLPVITATLGSPGTP